LQTGSHINMTVFWDVAPCSLVESDRRLKDAYCLHYQDDAIWNVSQFLQYYTAPFYFSPLHNLNMWYATENQEKKHLNSLSICNK
jgi:hypothetical protein